MKKENIITWSSKKVKAKDINPTPGNFKIKTKLGMERLQTSLSKFGRAGTVVVNFAAKAGKYDLIDGNSRLEKVMEKNPNELMEVSIPNRKLTPSEYKEMAAMFDFAVAGDVDINRIKGELGKTEDFYKKWGLEIPMEVLDKLGKGGNQEIGDLEYPEQKSKNGNASLIGEVKGIKMVSLFFSDKQETIFRKIEDKFMKKYKLDNTTDTALKIYQVLDKLIK